MAGPSSDRQEPASYSPSLSTPSPTPRPLFRPLLGAGGLQLHHLCLRTDRHRQDLYHGGRAAQQQRREAAVGGCVRCLRVRHMAAGGGARVQTYQICLLPHTRKR